MSLDKDNDRSRQRVKLVKRVIREALKTSPHKAPPWQPVILNPIVQSGNEKKVDENSSAILLAAEAAGARERSISFVAAESYLKANLDDALLAPNSAQMAWQTRDSGTERDRRESQDPKSECSIQGKPSDGG